VSRKKGKKEKEKENQNASVRLKLHQFTSQLRIKHHLGQSGFFHTLATHSYLIEIANPS